MICDRPRIDRGVPDLQAKQKRRSEQNIQVQAKHPAKAKHP
jgi:hypothetical protein